MERRLDNCINEAREKGGLDKYGSRKGRDRTDLKHILELNWPQATRQGEIPLAKLEDNRGAIFGRKRKQLRILYWIC